MPHEARPYVLHEATYRQLLDLKPNVAVLPWGATEAHNYHLPYGTDVVEVVALGEAAIAQANANGARCVLLPAMPFGMDHSQLNQVATITMRASTQAAVLHDVAQSLLMQGIDRLVLLNFHGGNEFKSMIRDVMLDLPIYIVQVHGHKLVSRDKLPLDHPGGDHADEYETNLMLHLTPGWVDMDAASEGASTPLKLKTLGTTPGVWAPRDWQTLTRDTGVGDPRRATADKGAVILTRLTQALAPLLIELSQAQPGDFPFVITPR
jgi:creatinine amidohydrolase